MAISSNLETLGFLGFGGPVCVVLSSRGVNRVDGVNGVDGVNWVNGVDGWVNGFDRLVRVNLILTCWKSGIVPVDVGPLV